MKTRLTLLGTAILVVVTALATSAFGQAQVTFTFDEYGNSTVNGNPGPLGQIVPDPINGVPTLFYPLPVPAVIPGDIYLYELPTAQQYSDLLSFAALPGVQLANGVWVFSDTDPTDPADAPADVPAALWPAPQPLVLLLDEIGPEGNNGLFNYAPGPGGIGGDPTGGVNLVYNFVSDGVIPEPSSLVLATLGSIGLAFLALRRRR